MAGFAPSTEDRSRRGEAVAWLVVTAWTLGFVVIPTVVQGFYEVHPIVFTLVVVFFGFVTVEGAAGIADRFGRARWIASRCFLQLMSVIALMASVEWLSLILRQVAIIIFVGGATGEATPVESLPTLSYLPAGLIPLALGAAGVRKVLYPRARYWVVFLACLGVTLVGTVFALFRYSATFEAGF